MICATIHFHELYATIIIAHEHTYTLIHHSITLHSLRFKSCNGNSDKSERIELKSNSARWDDENQ